MYLNPKPVNPVPMFPTPDEESPLLREWLMYWLETYIRPTAKAAGYEHYRDNWEKHIIPKLGNLRLCELTPSTLQRFFNEQAASGNLRDGRPLSAKSMRNMRAVLDIAIKQAIAEGKLAGNPVVLTVIKPVKNKRMQIMSNEMQQKLEEFLFTNKHYYNAGILLAMFTGLRLGEICALRWRDYDAARQRLSVTMTVRRTANYDCKPGEPKTRLVFNEAKTEASGRELTMPPVLTKLLEAQRLRYTGEFGIPNEDNFIVFSSSGSLIDPDNLSHYFSKLLNKRGLQHVKFHALRHTFATRAIENGIDVATVSGILGHADVTTTTHFYVQPREAAMDKAMRSIRPVAQEQPPVKAAI